MGLDKQTQVILDEALRWEEMSYELYTTALQHAKQENVKELLRWLADEELRHKEKILKVKEKGIEAVKEELDDKKPVDMGLLDSQTPPHIKEWERADIGDILKIAAAREKKAYEGYHRYAQITHDQKVKELLEWLANEELKHKEKIEKLYEEIFYEEF